MAGKNLDDPYLNESALNYHMRVAHAHKHLKNYPADSQIDSNLFKSLNDDIYNNADVDIASFHYLEKSLNLSILKVSNDIVFEKLSLGECQEFYQIGYIVTDLAARENKHSLKRWQGKLEEAHATYNSGKNLMLAHDLFKMTKLGELSAYINFRKDFIPETFTENSSMLVPHINEKIFERLQTVRIKKEPQ